MFQSRGHRRVLRLMMVRRFGLGRSPIGLRIRRWLSKWAHSSAANSPGCSARPLALIPSVDWLGCVPEVPLRRPDLAPYDTLLKCQGVSV